MNKIGIMVSAALFGLSACHFKSPNVAEQKVLIEKGAFPAGVPGWIATPTGGGSLGAGGVFAGGLIPQTFTGTTLRPSETAVQSAAHAGSSAGVFVAPRSVAPREVKVEDVEAASPLERIAKTCPSIESEVSQNLITTDLNTRIRNYESLTTRCPGSWDLWLWLGKDYEKDNQPVKAGRCFERVLILNSGNKEASDLLADNRRKLNNPEAGNDQ